MAKGTRQQRLIRWHRSWRVVMQRKFLVLRIERWPKPLPTSGVFKIWEWDSKTKQDPVAEIKGTFQAHKKKNHPGALFVPSEASGPDGGINPGQPARSKPGEYVWVTFQGQPRSKAYKLRVPTQKQEKVLMLGFTLLYQQADGSSGQYPTKITSRGVVRRQRGLVLDVEPLGQFGTTLKKTRYRDRLIVETFWKGDWTKAPLNRDWGDVIYRARPTGNMARMKPQGCSLAAFTAVMRFLRLKDSKTAYEHAMSQVSKLDDKYKPFVRVSQGKGKGHIYEKVDIPESWWPARLVWLTRQLAKYYEVPIRGGKKLKPGSDCPSKTNSRGQTVYEVCKYTRRNGLMYGYGEAPYDDKHHMLDLLGVHVAVDEQQMHRLSDSSPRWKRVRKKIKDALDAGFPAMALVHKTPDQPKMPSAAHW